MNKSIMMTILVAILGLGMYVHKVHAAPPIQVKCDMDPMALSNILSSGVTDGDKLSISGTCTGFGGHLITNNITLDGKGNSATLDGGSPVLTIDAANTVIIKDLIITGGFRAGGGNTPPFVTGIDNRGTLTLINSSVTGNEDQGGSTSVGGIRNDGTLTLIDSSVTENFARSASIAVAGIHNLANRTATLINSAVSLNTVADQSNSGFGTGGILNQGMLYISNSTIGENFVDGGRTGGIHNDKGTVMLVDSTVSKNIVTCDAPVIVGGISNDKGTVSLSNTTVSKNSADGKNNLLCTQAVGGIYNNSPGIGTLEITSNSTVSKNIAVGASANIGGIGILVGVALVPNITNSIVKNNDPNDCNFTHPACLVGP